MLGSLLVPHLWTANLLFIGLIQGLIVSVLAMGIVLIYRSSRVINFAVANLGVPAAALLAVMVVRSHFPYWPALVLAVGASTLAGALIDMFVIRRLFKAPRVIVLVATIGVAELLDAITIQLPDYKTGKFETAFPSPITSQWHLASLVNLHVGGVRLHVTNITITGPDLMALIIVPLVTLALWWLLGHTTFGESVRASATNSDLARLSGISPKMMSTAIWTIGGFLSAIAIILYATQQGSAELVQIGPETLLLGLTAALIGGMTSFPRTVVGALVVGLVYQVLTYNFPNTPGLVQFVLFGLVLVLVARMSRAEAGAAGESFAFAPRVPPIPERLREVWWVRRMPQVVAGLALVVAILLPIVVHQSAHHEAYTLILATALLAVSVTVLTGWAGQLSLGQAGFAGMGALSAAAFVRGITLNIGWRSRFRLADGSVRPYPMAAALILVVIAATAIGFVVMRRIDQRRRLLAAGVAVLTLAATAVLFPSTIDRSGDLHRVPFVLAVFLGAVIACIAAVGVGIGALRVKGLLLAISTLAFAIAAEVYIFPLPILTGSAGSQNAELDRGKLGPIDLTLHNRAYYFFTLACLVLVLLLVGHLRRTGIGRMIVGVRENEHGASAFTVSPTRTKLIAFALAGFVAGLGGALLGGAVETISFTNQFFRVEDSLSVVAMAVIGGLGSLAGAVTGALWVVGLPLFWPTNQTVQLFSSSIGLLIVLLYIPGGFTQLGYGLRGTILRWLEQRLPERATKSVTSPPVSLTRPAGAPITTNADGSVIATRGLTVDFGGLVAVDCVDFHADAGEVIGLIGTNGAGKSTLLNAIGGYVNSRGSVQLLGEEVSKLPPYQRARAGLGRTFQAATLFPELTVRETVQLALEARGTTSFWGSLLFFPPTVSKERAKRAEASELIDFLGLGRYADRFIAELSTGTRRIVELASVLAVAPRVVCLDEPTAGVAQREAEAFGPLIKRVQRELDATLVVVEHDLPLIMSISDRIYCLEAGAIIAEGSPEAVRSDPLVVSSYLGTDDRAIHRSNAADPAAV
jgi:ABC-type branched-subunit amino acid transport system ATPase component/ABC-type branched-subunit amino acid transport system permease subunit